MVRRCRPPRSAWPPSGVPLGSPAARPLPAPGRAASRRVLGLAAVRGQQLPRPGVTTPLAGTPSDRWSRVDRGLVRGPKRPSTGPGRSPRVVNLTWSARTRGDPSGCAKPAPRRSGSFCALVSARRVRRTDDPVGRDRAAAWKRVTAASVHGPYNPSTGPGCQPSRRSVRCTDAHRPLPRRPGVAGSVLEQARPGAEPEDVSDAPPAMLVPGRQSRTRATTKPASPALLKGTPYVLRIVVSSSSGVRPGASERPEVLVRSSGGLARPLDDCDERELPPLRRREAQAAVVLQRERRSREEQCEEEAEGDAGARRAGRAG